MGVWGWGGGSKMTPPFFGSKIGGFGDLSDPVVPTLRGVSGDVVTIYAY